MGYSDIGPFGCEIATPNLDRLAGRRLRLTQLPHHPGLLARARRDADRPQPAPRGLRERRQLRPRLPRTCAWRSTTTSLTLPEVLRAPRATRRSRIGKWHLTRDALMNDGADQGHLAAAAGLRPLLRHPRGLQQLLPPQPAGRATTRPLDIAELPEDYYLTDDLTDQAVGMIKGLRANDSRKPFFLYFAHHAMHGPLGAQAGATCAQYRGRYDEGWDAHPRARLATPDRARASSRPDTPLPAAQRRAGLRRARLGRPARRTTRELLRPLHGGLRRDGRQRRPERRPDPGHHRGARRARQHHRRLHVRQRRHRRRAAPRAPAATSAASCTCPASRRTGRPTSPRDPDLIGGPRTMVHYPRGWGMASNTPFRFYKGQTFAGGVRVPFLVSWPDGLPRAERRRRVRPQYQYVTDVLPTAAGPGRGSTHPGDRNGRAGEVDRRRQLRARARRAGHAPSTHPEQYAEFGGNRGYYRDGWKIVTNHRAGHAVRGRRVGAVRRRHRPQRAAQPRRPTSPACSRSWPRPGSGRPGRTPSSRSGAAMLPASASGRAPSSRARSGCCPARPSWSATAPAG